MVGPNVLTSGPPFCTHLPACCLRASPRPLLSCVATVPLGPEHTQQGLLFPCIWHRTKCHQSPDTRGLAVGMFSVCLSGAVCTPARPRGVPAHCWCCGHGEHLAPQHECQLPYWPHQGCVGSPGCWGRVSSWAGCSAFPSSSDPHCCYQAQATTCVPEETATHWNAVASEYVCDCSTVVLSDPSTLCRVPCMCECRARACASVPRRALGCSQGSSDLDTLSSWETSESLWPCHQLLSQASVG